MGLKASYTFFAPIYDLAVDPFTRRARQESLRALEDVEGKVLLVGVGTGLDAPFLPPGKDYVGLDLTYAMLKRAKKRFPGPLVQGDAMALPFRDESFQAVVMHLILAVVPDGSRALAEACRVLAPGGRLLVLDKFLRRGSRAPVRRALTPLTAPLATRLDVELEALIEGHPELRCLADEPAMVRGWFRRVVFEKAVP